MQEQATRTKAGSSVRSKTIQASKTSVTPLLAVAGGLSLLALLAGAGDEVALQSAPDDQSELDPELKAWLTRITAPTFRYKVIDNKVLCMWKHSYRTPYKTIEFDRWTVRLLEKHPDHTDASDAVTVLISKVDENDFRWIERNYSSTPDIRFGESDKHTRFYPNDAVIYGMNRSNMSYLASQYLKNWLRTLPTYSDKDNLYRSETYVNFISNELGEYYGKTKSPSSNPSNS